MRKSWFVWLSIYLVTFIITVAINNSKVRKVKQQFTHYHRADAVVETYGCKDKSKNGKYILEAVFLNCPPSSEWVNAMLEAKCEKVVVMSNFCKKLEMDEFTISNGKVVFRN